MCSLLPSLPVTTKNTAGRAGVRDPLAASLWRGMQGKALSQQTSSSGWASPGAGTNPAPSTLLSSFMDKVQLPKPGYM